MVWKSFQNCGWIWKKFPKGIKPKRTKDFSLLESQKPGFEVFFGIKFFIFYYKPFLYKIKEKKKTEEKKYTEVFIHHIWCFNKPEGLFLSHFSDWVKFARWLTCTSLIFICSPLLMPVSTTASSGTLPLSTWITSSAMCQCCLWMWKSSLCIPTQLQWILLRK